VSRPAKMATRHPWRRIPAAVAALLLLVLAVLLGWAAGRQLLSRRWPGFADAIFGQLANTAWTSVLGWSLGVGLVLVGLGLIFLARRAGRGRSLAVTTPSSPQVRDGAAYVTGAGLARLAEARIRDIDGVDRVAVIVAGRRVRARIRTSLVDTQTLQTAVRSAVTEQAQQIGVSPAPKVSVKTAHQAVGS
jgi:hypothetical protein